MNSAPTVSLSTTVAFTIPASASVVAFWLIVTSYPDTSYPLSVKVTSVPTGTFSITHVYGFSVLPSPLAAFPSVNTSSL